MGLLLVPISVPIASSSSKDKNQPIWNIGGGGGGAAPDMRDQRVFASNNSRVSVSKQTLNDKMQPPPIVRKFSAAGYAT